MKKIFCIYVIFIIVSCNEKKPEKELINTIDTVAKASPKINTVKIIPTVKTNDSIIIAKFPKDSIATTISGLLGEAPKNVAVLIDIKQGKNLSAILRTHDTKANIRINQIYTPDGKADGPFGREINKPILKRGTYKLIIGHDLMAEGGSAVKFELRIVVN